MTLQTLQDSVHRTLDEAKFGTVDQAEWEHLTDELANVMFAPTTEELVEMIRRYIDRNETVPVDSKAHQLARALATALVVVDM